MIGLKLFPEKREKKIDSVFLKINKHDFFKTMATFKFLYTIPTINMQKIIVLKITIFSNYRIKFQ